MREVFESIAEASPAFTHDAVDEFLEAGWLLGLGHGEALVSWGRCTRSAVPVPGALQHYSCDFYGEDKAPWSSFEHSARVPVARLLAALDGHAGPPPRELRFREPDFDTFAGQFRRVGQAIAVGQIQKAVPVVFATADAKMTKTTRAHCIRQLLRRVQGQTPYALLGPTAGIIGGTPESLFSFDSGSPVLCTMALAGTRASADERASSLLVDSKERLEHRLVVDGLRQKLQGLGALDMAGPRVWELGPLCHLRTDLRLRLANASVRPEKLFAELVTLLHPTAALGVAPASVDWRRFLKSLGEPVARARFGAPFGVVDPEGRSQALVAIRNVQWNDGGPIVLGSGCGVVPGSQLEREWLELALKRRSVRELLGL